jgi:hypothetical protein
MFQHNALFWRTSAEMEVVRVEFVVDRDDALRIGFQSPWGAFEGGQDIQEGRAAVFHLLRHPCKFTASGTGRADIICIKGLGLAG